MVIENVNIYDLIPSQIIEMIQKLNCALDVIKSRKQTMTKVASFEKGKTNCPHCNSDNIIKYGHSISRIQNYMCKSCSKKFNDLTGTVFSGTHLTYEQIDIFLQCHNDKISIRKTSKRMGVDKNTVHLLRLKLNDSFAEARKNILLNGNIESDELYKSINLKGTKPKDMPRFSKHRASKGTTTQGISSHKVCIVSAIDDEDHMFLEIAGTGPITSDMVKLCLTPKMGEVKQLTTDCKSSYEREATTNHWVLKQVKAQCYVDNDGNNLANINSIHSNLSSFLHNFRGVSTKHLQGYLDWFSFDKYLQYTTEEQYQIHSLLKNSMTNSTMIVIPNMYDNYSGIDFKEVYSDYHYNYQP